MQVGEKDDWLCRTTVSLTLYLPDSPTKAQVLDAWRVYAEVCPQDHMYLVRNMRMPEFHELSDTVSEADITPYLVDQDRRRDEGLLIWDGLETDAWAFRIEGVFVPDEPPQASYCQVLFPDEVEPARVKRMAQGLANCLPFLSGHGGYSVLFRAQEKFRAFNKIFAWSKRYLGLEVEDLNRTLPAVLNGVKGANWLTLVGNDLWSRLVDENSGREPMFAPPVEMYNARNGKIIMAGARPVMSDRNRGEFPEAYAAVEKAISSIKIDSHPEFSGRFGRDEETMNWLNRLVEPENW